MMRIPEIGSTPDELIERLEDAKSQDVDWRKGRSWSLVYYGGDKHTEFLKQVYNLYFSENGAGPSLFPSLQRMEAEVVAMVLALADGDDGTVGTMTSGGTESILLAMKAYRDRALTMQSGISNPTILVPESAHPAFLKAAQYFGLKVVPIQLNSAFQCDVDLVKRNLTDQTICIIASAPSFAHGVIDPIAALGEVALAHNIGLHVDACLGGMMLPFLKKLDCDVPRFGFDVAGVSSISTDLHKNGYAAKGASAILYRDKTLRRYQFFVSSDWPGGALASPSMLGTRPGGAIAAAWAAIMALGEQGYLELASSAMQVTRKLMAGINAIPGLYVVGKPDMNVFSFSSDKLNMFTLGDRIDAMGWRVNRQNHPPSLHLVVTPNHADVADEFLGDLAIAVDAENREPNAPVVDERAILYGGTRKIPSGSDDKEIMYSRIENLYKL